MTLDLGHSTLDLPFGMHMEDLVYDFPFAIDFEKRKKVSEAMTGPVFEFQAHGSSRLEDVDANDPAFKFRRRPILVVPVKQILDWPSQQIMSDVTKDGCVLSGRRVSFQQCFPSYRH